MPNQIITLDDALEEINRLRELLLDNGIDPEPYISEPEQFGPPTEWEWKMRKLFENAFNLSKKSWIDQVSHRHFLEGTTWPTTLTIRLPEDFMIKPSK